MCQVGREIINYVHLNHGLASRCGARTLQRDRSRTSVILVGLDLDQSSSRLRWRPSPTVSGRDARHGRELRNVRNNGSERTDGVTDSADTFDYIVTGAGSAGAAVAARLSESGRY